jgi:hypothetical protein
MFHLAREDLPWTKLKGLTVVSIPARQSALALDPHRKLYHVNDHKSANRVGIAIFSLDQPSLNRRQQ